MIKSKEPYKQDGVSYLTLNNIVTLKSGLDVTKSHLNWYHSKTILVEELGTPKLAQIFAYTHT